VEVGVQVPVTGLEEVIVRLAGQLGVRPDAGEVEVDRLTVPVNPPEGVTVIVEDPVDPEVKSAGVVAEIVKSVVPVGGM